MFPSNPPRDHRQEDEDGGIEPSQDTKSYRGFPHRWLRAIQTRQFVIKVTQILCHECPRDQEEQPQEGKQASQGKFADKISGSMIQKEEDGNCGYTDEDGHERGEDTHARASVAACRGTTSTLAREIGPINRLGEESEYKNREKYFNHAGENTQRLNNLVAGRHVYVFLFFSLYSQR